MPRVSLCERHVCRSLNSGDAPLQIDPFRRSEYVQVADTCIQAETLTCGIAKPEIPLPRRPFFDRNQRRHHRRLRVDVVRANLDGFEQAQGAYALLRLLDCTAPEQIARCVGEPFANDAAIDTVVSRKVDRSEDTN